MSNLDFEYTKQKCESVIKSIKMIFNSNNMEELNKDAYNFVRMKMGFIAHYDHITFIGVYQQLGVDKFAENLITGEFGLPNFNKTRSESFMNGGFDDQYSPETARRIGKTIRTIVAIAKQKGEANERRNYHKPK